ncbi:DUF4303 domain-containing protein [Brenneria sp. 4F2]|nr:DUF4303 domain-containing protein [Brenneria bubanii]
MDWSDFESECRRTVNTLISAILAENPDEHFYAFCLYTDSSAMAVSLAANSEEKLKSVLDADSDKSKENQNYYRWATSEWAYEDFGADLFAELSAFLRKSPEREHFPVFKNRLIHSLAYALSSVVAEIFQNRHDAAVMFVSITDDDEAEDIENSSSEIINTEIAHNLFLTRYDHE